jgi:hypothetical protein
MSTLDETLDDYVTKYMGVLGIVGERPIVKLRSNLGSKWLGRSTWSSKRPHSTILELQQSILSDDRTLERVIAHEMIHHRDALAISTNDIVLMGVGIKPESHGASFREGAARINAVMGPGFVTEVSDKEYSHAPSKKKFFVLITPLPDGRFGWTWAARLGAQAKTWIDAKFLQGSRLVQTADERWARGRKIVRYGGYSVPRDSQDAALLQQLYDAG